MSSPFCRMSCMLQLSFPNSDTGDFSAWISRTCSTVARGALSLTRLALCVTGTLAIS
jgi:hypothetical protein